jgi:hypothetical protein
VSARPRHPAVSAAADQARAAADDISHRVRAGYQFNAAREALATGAAPLPVGEHAGPPTGRRAEVLARVRELLESGGLRACEHAAAELSPGGLVRARGPRPEALLWVSWHPDLISCAACAITLPKPSVDEDYRCDGCGRVGAPGSLLEAVSYVVRGSAEHAARSGHLAPPLICSFGLCLRCSNASGSAPG